ncbi:MAG: Na(+)-translocating NADH-quinone reductase subunit A [Candidatus Hydrogenedentes bacterium]|nr:Na(+)-translocating NADH-quinone reductase subunit A [Candidatus Hydrogenedentota bacterium]
MALHKINKGLNLPIAGEPEQTIQPANRLTRVGLVAEDYLGIRPTMFVAVGDTVRRGQALFEDKKIPGVRFTAPGAGTVVAVNRGERRALQSVVIDLNENERGGKLSPDDEAVFASYTGKDPAGLSNAEIKALLLESGLWTAIRARPFSKVANPETTPHSIFITAMDTHPLAPSVDVVMKGREADFERGLICVAKLTEGKTYLCKAPGSSAQSQPYNGVVVEEFEGVHPAGTVGVHIHFLDPVHRDKAVWHLGYQDVMAIGHLFATGKLDVRRVVSLAGPQVKKPRLLRTRLGAAMDELVAGELKDGENRVISGSVLSGRAATGQVFGYLGRYCQQISVIREGREREFLGWLSLGKNMFSAINVCISKLTPGKKFDFTTCANGSERAIVPIGVYERVMPMDILPTFLLRSLVMNDVERAEQLGCLELDEEDLALCTFVCPGKIDYGPILRRNLERIESEG